MSENNNNNSGNNNGNDTGGKGNNTNDKTRQIPVVPPKERTNLSEGVDRPKQNNNNSVSKVNEL